MKCLSCPDVTEEGTQPLTLIDLVSKLRAIKVPCSIGCRMYYNAGLGNTWQSGGQFKRDD